MIWIDAQLSPAISRWIKDHLGLEAEAIRDLGLREAEDKRIFDEARIANSVVLTKDSDFVRLLERYGPPPRIILLTCGNTSNANLKVILKTTLRDAIKLLNEGEELVEIQ